VGKTYSAIFLSSKDSFSDKDLAFLFILDVVFYVIIGSLTGLETLIMRIIAAGIALISSITCWLFFSKKWLKHISDIRITIFNSVDEDEKTSSYYSIAILLSLTFYLIFPDILARNVLMLLIILLFWGFFRTAKFGDGTYGEEAFEKLIDSGIGVDAELDVLPDGERYGEFLKDRAGNEQQKDDSPRTRAMTIRKVDSVKIIIIVIIGVIIVSISYFGPIMRDNIFNTNIVTFKCDKLTGYSASEAHFHAIFQFLNTGGKDISLSHIQIKISLVNPQARILLASKETGTLFLPKSNEVFRVESHLNIDYTEFGEYLKSLNSEFGDSKYQAIIQSSDILIELSAEVKRGFLSRRVVYSDSFPYSNIEWI
jgi:hypothetical protein